MKNIKTFMLLMSTLAAALVSFLAWFLTMMR